MSVRVRDVVNNPERGEERKNQFPPVECFLHALLGADVEKSTHLQCGIVKLQFLVGKAVRRVFRRNLRSLIDQQLRKHLNYDRVLTSAHGEEFGAVRNNSCRTNWTLFVFIDSPVCR